MTYLERPHRLLIGAAPACTHTRLVGCDARTQTFWLAAARGYRPLRRLGSTRGPGTRACHCSPVADVPGAVVVPVLRLVGHHDADRGSQPPSRDAVRATTWRAFVDVEREALQDLLREGGSGGRGREGDRHHQRGRGIWREARSTLMTPRADIFAPTASMLERWRCASRNRQARHDLSRFARRAPR